MDSSERLAKNNSYYDKFISEVKQRGEFRDFSKALDLFLVGIDPSKTILDVGCGTGIHLKEFENRGFAALGIEPSQKMRELVKENGLKAIDGAFETLNSLALPSVAGIWCAASLLHVPRVDLRKTFEILKGLLPKNGPFYFTVRLGEGSKWDSYDGRDSGAERFIQLFSEEELLKELSLLSFIDIQSWLEDSTWGRSSKWISVVAKKG
jgi:SAM-dependent methyltransferase